MTVTEIDEPFEDFGSLYSTVGFKVTLKRRSTAYLLQGPIL